jgi:hypothetical protein
MYDIHVLSARLNRSLTIKRYFERHCRALHCWNCLPNTIVEFQGGPEHATGLSAHFLAGSANTAAEWDI